MSYDLIIGNTWLLKAQAKLNYRNETLSILWRGQEAEFNVSIIRGNKNPNPRREQPAEDDEEAVFINNLEQVMPDETIEEHYNYRSSTLKENKYNSGITPKQHDSNPLYLQWN
jgi:hypothetical protein